MKGDAVRDDGKALLQPVRGRTGSFRGRLNPPEAESVEHLAEPYSEETEFHRNVFTPDGGRYWEE